MQEVETYSILLTSGLNSLKQLIQNKISLGYKVVTMESIRNVRTLQTEFIVVYSKN